MSLISGLAIIAWILFLLDLVIPDPLPFVDEAALFFIALFLSGFAIKDLIENNPVLLIVLGVVGFVGYKMLRR